MRFSLWLYPYGRWGGLEAMGDAAARAEALGFAGVSVSDHVICTTGPESDGVTPVWPDWSVLATYLATRTEQLRIMASLVVPYRPALVQAKQIATIDALSGGRFIFAAAVGWLEREFAMLGVPFRERGAITDEYLRAMKALWSQDQPEFEGRYVRFRDIVFEPRCAQDPHVPIWIAGGSGPGPLRRLVELGDGWMPMGSDSASTLRDTIARVKERVAERGRDPEALTFRYTIGVGAAEEALARLSSSAAVGAPSTIGRADVTAEQVAEAIDDYEGAGFNELAINFAGASRSEVMERLEWFAGAVMPLVAR
jgi:probable F420-dependent oxidoreductase